MRVNRDYSAESTPSIVRQLIVRHLWRVAVAAAFLLTSTPAWAADRQYSHALLVDSEALTDDERARLLAKVGEIVGPSKDAWDSVQVADKQSVFRLIGQRYGYFDGRTPRTARMIGDLIKDANSLEDLDSVKKGQPLLMPPLPVRPTLQRAAPNLVQALNITAPAAPTLMITSAAAPSFQRPLTLSDGGTWFITGSRRDLALVRSALPDTDSVRRGVYDGPTDEMVTLHLPKATQTTSGVPTASRSISPAIASISALRSPAYYIVDFFTPSRDEPCPHGLKVLDVARQTVRAFGGDQLAGRIEPIEVDFFADKRRSGDLLRRYIQFLGKSRPIDANLRGTADRLLAQSRKDVARYDVPLLYLQALYHDLVSRSDAAVVSSSFWIRFDGSKFLPSSYRPISSVVLVSAVSDADLFIEDVSTEEPIRQYYDYRLTYPVALIGAERGPGVTLGMTSRDGDGVTFVGRGYGWGDQSTCIRPSDLGTSFATPALGASLYLVRALWQHQNRQVTAAESKVRMLLASSLNTAYAGKYASAGIPNVQLLLDGKSSYAMSSEGKVVDIRDASGSIDYVDGVKNGHELLTTLRFRRGHGGFAGIHAVGDA
ncbi:MAG TPA: hypothetical protein VGR43_09805, partial [Dehalococcoidia bacterium]|nr:hypothetical protein [Dehalococcoidia bacterium]